MADKPSLAEMLAKDGEELSPSTTTTAASTTVVPDIAPETPETPVVEATQDTQAATETPEAEEASESPSADLMAWAKEVFPDKANIIGLYKSDEEMMKGLLEASTLVGKRNEEAEYAKRLREYGVTEEDIARIVEEKRNPGIAKTSPTAEISELWNPAWVTEDENGQWVITSEGRKIPDIQRKIANYRTDLSTAMRDPAKWDGFVEKYSGKKKTDPKVEIDRVRQEMAQKDLERQVKEFEVKHDKVLFAGDSFTQLGQEVFNLLQDGGFYPSATFTQRAEKAMQFAAAIIAPQPSKRTIPVPAKRQTPVAAGKNVKLTVKEFRDKFPDAGLYDIVQYEEKGILPKS